MKNELKDLDLEVVSSGKSALGQQTTQQQGGGGGGAKAGALGS